MKRIISVTIALCLVFCSVLPVYAEAWTSQQASTVTATVNSIAGFLANFSTHFTDWVGVGANTSGMTSTWNQFYTRWLVFQTDFNNMVSWLVPSGPNSTSTATMLDSIIVLTNYAMNHLPDISIIAGYVASWMSTNNSLMTQLRDNLVNAVYYTGENFNQQKFAHLQLPWVSNTSTESYYRLYDVGANGTNNLKGVAWIFGSPLGNLAVMLNQLIENDAKEYNYRWVADLKHYNDNLTTWDSQGSTLTQVAFTPESAIQGLYRYLAFTQRDVARLAYVFANDEELEARELAQANQEQVLDDFIDPTGNGAVSTTDLGSMADASGSFKDNFDTGQSASGIWNVFNRDYDWFSQTTANNLQPSLARGSEEYSTPYLDEYFKELDGILEVNKRD